MHRRKRKIKHCRHMSRLEKENLIEIQAEAYYRALKQIDKENHSLEKFVAINQEERRTKKETGYIDGCCAFLHFGGLHSFFSKP